MKRNEKYKYATGKQINEDSGRDIWECACGNGAMSEVIKENGYNVYSSDLIDRGYGDIGIDFLQSNRKVDNIVTNPPFNLATEFTLKAFELAKHKVVMLSNFNFIARD